MTEPPLATQPTLGNPFGGKAAELRFVGRETQLTELLSALPPSAQHLKLISGDAGIGKSRLVAQVIAHVQQRGHTVAWGFSGDADGAPAFWPWTQVVRSLLRTTSGSDLGALLLDDPTATRFDLFNAVADLLLASQEQAPLVIVLEDLHDADQQSVALLRFLVRQLPSHHILFLGTFRPKEVRDPDVREQLRLLSAPGVRIDLRGLSLAELTALIPHDGPNAAELHAITGGNPLFAEEVLRLWVTRGDLSAARGFVGVTTDSSLRSVTRSRLEQLSATTRPALSAIAVHGRSIGMADLSRLMSESPSEASARIAPSITAGVLVVAPATCGTDEISFAHILLANAAVELTPIDELRTLHHQCATLLAGRPGRGAARAHHLLQSGAQHAAEALAACEVAGREAMATLAFEDAVSHFRQALRVIDLFGAGDVARRTLVVIELGTAQWAEGDYSDADASFQSAWDQATDRADVHGQALTALGPGFRIDFTGKAALQRATKCTIALAALPKAPSALRARLLATLAAAQLVQVDQSAVSETMARATAVKALAMAEDIGDDLATGYALIASIVTDLDPDTLDHRLSAARRAVAIAREHRDRELASNGYFLLLAALLETGDIRAIDAQLEPHRDIVETFKELRNSRHAGWFRCSRALLDGNVDLAEQFAHSSFEIAQRHHDPDAHSVWIAQISIMRWMHGRTGEVEGFYLQAHREEPWRQVWVAVLAWLEATHGSIDEATDAVASVGAISDVPRDRHWFLTMSTLAEVVSITGDTRAAHILRDALIPYGARLVPVGLGIAAWGTVARPLGLLARLLGRGDEAIAHFRQSVRVCMQAGAMPWLVESQLDLAEALRDFGDDAMGSEAISRARSAHSTAQDLGLETFMARADTVLASFGTESSSNDTPTESIDGTPENSRVEINVLGRFEVTATDGSVSQWTSRKARALLQILVAARGGSIPRERMMDTLWPGGSPSALSNRMSVAISTVRRALDPGRLYPPHHFLQAEQSLLQLNCENLTTDIEEFFDGAKQAFRIQGSSRDVALTRAIDRYSGEAFADEPYADWAQHLRHEAQDTFAALCRLRAESASMSDNPLLAAELHRRVLSFAPYDEQSHRGLIAALESLGVDGQARLAREHYRTKMSEIAS